MSNFESSLIDKLKSFEKQSIFFGVDEVSANARRAAKDREFVDMFIADEMQKVDEANAREVYETANSKAEDAAKGKETHGNVKINSNGITLFSIMGAIVGVAALVGAVMGIVAGVAFSATGAGIGIGLLCITAGVALAGAAFGTYCGVQSCINGDSSYANFLFGGDFNVDGNGDTVHSGKGIFDKGAGQGPMDYAAYQEWNGKAQTAYNDIQTILRKISTYTNVKYSEAQSNETNAVEASKKAMQYQNSLTANWR
jgi:hypothetical protein